MRGERRTYESWCSISDLFYQHAPSSQGPWLPPRAISGETEASGWESNSSILSSSNTTSMVASAMPQWQPHRASCLPVTSWLVPSRFPIRCHHPTVKEAYLHHQKWGVLQYFNLPLHYNPLTTNLLPPPTKCFQWHSWQDQKKNLPARFLLSFPLKNSGGTVLFSTFSSPHPPTVTHSVPFPLWVHHSTHPLTPS